MKKSPCYYKGSMVSCKWKRVGLYEYGKFNEKK